MVKIDAKKHIPLVRVLHGLLWGQHLDALAFAANIYNVSLGFEQDERVAQVGRRIALKVGSELLVERSDPIQAPDGNL